MSTSFISYGVLASAHLDLDTHAGRASVGICVQLGVLPGPPQPLPNDFRSTYKEDSPPRHRRLGVQLLHRQVKAGEPTRNETAVEASKNTHAEEASKTEVAVEADENNEQSSSKSVEEKDNNQLCC